MLKRNPYPGRFIVFEGMDGCGKSTQCERAYNYVLAGGEKALKVKEPNKDVLGGKLIYGLLFGKGPIRFSDMSQLQRQSYYFFNRMIHYRDVVIPALQQGQTVLSDRSLASIALDVQNEGDIERLLLAEEYHFEQEQIELIIPDAVLIYDLPEEMAIARLNEKDERRCDFFEQPGKIARTREAYREFGSKFPDFCRMIDARGSVEEVFTETRGMLHEYLNLSAWQ